MTLETYLQHFIFIGMKFGSIGGLFGNNRMANPNDQKKNRNEFPFQKLRIHFRLTGMKFGNIRGLFANKQMRNSNITKSNIEPHLPIL